MSGKAISKAISLEEDRFPDAALDVIYDTFDDLLISGEFKMVNLMLKNLNLDSLSPLLITGIATVTHYAAEHLPARQRLINYMAGEDE